jgi:putative transposase
LAKKAQYIPGQMVCRIREAEPKLTSGAEPPY